MSPFSAPLSNLPYCLRHTNSPGNAHNDRPFVTPLQQVTLRLVGTALYVVPSHQGGRCPAVLPLRLDSGETRPSRQGVLQRGILPVFLGELYAFIRRSNRLHRASQLAIPSYITYAQMLITYIHMLITYTKMPITYT